MYFLIKSHAKDILFESIFNSYLYIHISHFLTEAMFKLLLVLRIQERNYYHYYH